MLLLAGHFRLPAEVRAKAQAAMQLVIAASRAEAGCIAYSYAEDVLEPGLFSVTELWDNQAALDAHFAMPHMQKWREDREEFGMTDRVITAYTVNGAINI